MALIVVASDSPDLADDVEAALAGPDTTVVRLGSGHDVLPAVRERMPDLTVLDLQIGNMGAMAVSLDLRNEEDAGRLGHVPTLLLLDRAADVFLARRSRADGWLIKPTDPMRLRRAATAVREGTGVFEGAPDLQAPPPTPESEGDEGPDDEGPDDEAAGDEAAGDEPTAEPAEVS